jgi:hypothetical protein
MNKEIAHLFWHGELTNLEKVCIQSFVKQGFNTKIWSYTNIQVDGAESCDARLILPEEHLTKYKQAHFKLTDGLGDVYASLAAFSDVFRINVVNRFGGWWFDTDCYCLKSSEDFTKLRENISFVACLQDFAGPVNSAAFCADYEMSSKLVKCLEDACKVNNYTFDKWGAIGPGLFSYFIQANDLYDNILSTEKFYSIEPNNFSYFVEPNLKQLAKSYIVNSYVAHIWHSQLSVNNIDKNNPPKDSLLEEFYNGTYLNTEIENAAIKTAYATARERYIEISNLYKKLFNHPGSFDELKYYSISGMSYKDIEKTLYNNNKDYKRIEIQKLYKEILNREADIGGLEHYTNSQYGIDEIKNMFLNSDEYKNN